MPSSPPISTRPLGLPPLVVPRRASWPPEPQPTGLCFAVSGGPPGCSRSVPAGGARLDLLSDVTGRVTRVAGEVLELDDRGHRVRVQHLLPPSVDLAALLDHRVRIEVRHLLASGRVPTIDARIRSPEGTLLLWARDGRLPAEGPVEGAAVRVRCDDADAPRLAVAWAGDVATCGAGQALEVGSGGDAMTVLALRVGAGDAAFVLARGR